MSCLDSHRAISKAIRCSRSFENVPHASEKLNETAIPESQRNDNMRIGSVASMHIQGRQDEGGKSKGGEAQRSRVSELAMLIWSPLTNLQRTTKGLGSLTFKHIAEVGVVVMGEAAGMRLATVGMNVALSSVIDGGVGSRHDGLICAAGIRKLQNNGAEERKIQYLFFNWIPWICRT